MDQNQTLNSEDTRLPSSPPAVFSDNTTRPSSPPSSPPGFPWDGDNAPKSNPQPPQKSAFSLLGKCKALSFISDNARPTKKPAVAKKETDNGALTQMQISLGQEVQKRCKMCGMEYVPSSTEDRKLHDKYHRQNTEGCDVGKDFMRNAREGTTFEGAREGDIICQIDCNDRAGRKMKAQAVLEIVQRELGAVAIEREDIWDAKQANIKACKYKSYLYVRGTKCLGFLLVEKISEAQEVVAPDKAGLDAKEDGETNIPRYSTAASALKRKREAAAEELEQAASSLIELSKATVGATLGVSRIWTSSCHRRQNVASSLLDAALRHHMQTVGLHANSAGHKDELGEQNTLPKTAIDKDKVAFSQPTESGARLARRWVGKVYGWKVYVD